MFGHWEILAVVLVALLLFGGKRIPELARGLGKSVTNFKAGLKEDQSEEAETTAQTESDAPQKEEVS
ncbi:twin-arginine translocase TatA/TatE family subunit [Candidatus Poribacteria bacterium]|nr:twin-arginine translocase TatA/TatE family subunit [Candidatus Poribacteria bacterium]